jgi:hypothetical protein
MLGGLAFAVANHEGSSEPPGQLITDDLDQELN